MEYKYIYIYNVDVDKKLSYEKNEWKIRYFITLSGAFERKSPEGFSKYYPAFFIAFKARQG